MNEKNQEESNQSITQSPISKVPGTVLVCVGTVHPPLEVGGHYFIVVLLAVIVVVKELFALFYVTKDIMSAFYQY